MTRGDARDSEIMIRNMKRKENGHVTEIIKGEIREDKRKYEK